jgi:hypothetical protein
MSADNLKNNLNTLAKIFLWDVVFVNPIGGGDSEVLNVRCQSTTKPGRSFGAILVDYKATAGVKFPGRMRLTHTFPCTFVESTDAKTYDALYKWMQAISHDRLNVGLPDILIKADIYLNLLAADGKISEKIKLTGAYVELLDETPLNYSTDAGIVYSVTFSYDRWEKVK